jgi:hypothetical protein
LIMQIFSLILSLLVPRLIPEHSAVFIRKVSSRHAKEL